MNEFQTSLILLILRWATRFPNFSPIILLFLQPFLQYTVKIYEWKFSRVDKSRPVCVLKYCTYLYICFFCCIIRCITSMRLTFDAKKYGVHIFFCGALRALLNINIFITIFLWIIRIIFMKILSNLQPTHMKSINTCSSVVGRLTTYI